MPKNLSMTLTEALNQLPVAHPTFAVLPNAKLCRMGTALVLRYDGFLAIVEETSSLPTNGWFPINSCPIAEPTFNFPPGTEWEYRVV